MKRTFKYALSAVLSVCLVAPAFAQEGFADVKDSHWAADAVNRLKALGLIHGVGNNKFDGNAKVTRYEMASMVYAIYAKLVCFNEEIEVKIKALEAKVNSVKPATAPAAPDYSDIRSSLAELQKEFGTIKAWGADVQQLQKMSTAYSNELKSLGVDISAMKKNISDLSSRLAKLEKGPGGINITGDVNFFMAANAKSAGSATAIDQDGRYLQGTGVGAGIDTLTVLHELGVKISDKATEVPYSAEFVIGNTQGLGGGFNPVYRNGNVGAPILEGATTVYIHELNATLKNWGATIGRQGLSLGKYILSRPDTTSFYSNSRWDNHKFQFDGVNASFGGDNGNLFVGIGGNGRANDGFAVNPIQGVNSARLMGANYSFNLGESGKVTGTYLLIDGDGLGGSNFDGSGNTLPAGTNRQNIYGVDLGYKFGNVNVDLGGGKSAAYNHGTVLNNNNNARYNIGVGIETEEHYLKVGYRRIEANYAAPGDWGRVSVFRNLVDTITTSAAGGIKLGGDMSLAASYEKGDGIVGPGSYNTWRVGASKMITPKWKGSVSYENTDFDGGFQGFAANANSKFTTFKLGYDLGAANMLSLFWQNSDLTNVVTNKAALGTAQKGSVFGANYSIKF
ncbi:MAG TPA: S-layer homology domain-containing protein [Fimbriimonas sp.]|nr:S-layer homology domain-containing protein [Fimbriimonas sp.]